MHSILGAVIHGLIYGLIFHVMRGMSIYEVILTVVIGLSAVALVYWWWHKT